MERHFILPATIAAALHAGLLFGFRSQVHPLPPLVTKIILGPDSPPLPPELPPPPPESKEEVPIPPKGTAVEPPPSLREHPEPPSPEKFTVEVPRHEPTNRVDLSAIPHGPPGVPEGAEQFGPPKIGIVRLGDLDNPPRARVQGAPIYPPDARRNALSGEVWVEFSVDETGAVFEARAVRSSDRIFEEAALRAVSRWRFEPGKRDGRIVRFRMAVPIVFSLADN